MNYIEKLNEYIEKNDNPIVKMIDGEPKNINPITEQPESKMRLYEIYGLYFDNKEELEMYCQEHDLSSERFTIYDYLGNFAGRTDVIRTVNHQGRIMYLTAVDPDGYGMYNHKRSVYRGEFIWEYHHGQIREYYKSFRERGIVFYDDIYAKIDEEDKKKFQKMKELHLFNY